VKLLNINPVAQKAKKREKAKKPIIIKHQQV
jgi:hypothetical protein